jgi:hypothetical protein
MASLGTYKINKMLIRDYADGKTPSRVFRTEIDIPLGSEANHKKLLDLLGGPHSKKTDEAILRFLLRKLGTVASAAPRKQKAQWKAARNFLAATFDLEPPPTGKKK